MNYTSNDEQMLGLAILAATSEPPHTQEVIANYMGVTRQRVDQIEKIALRKLRIRMCERLGLKVETVRLKDLLKIKS